MRARSSIMLIMVTSLVAGCSGGGDSSKAIVYGKVTYKGKDLPIGTVSFFDEKDQQIASGGLAGGKYRVEKLTPGAAKITITTPLPEAKEPPKDAAATGLVFTVVPIPPAYGNVKTSGLTYTIKAGEQNHDIELK